MGKADRLVNAATDANGVRPPRERRVVDPIAFERERLVALDTPHMRALEGYRTTLAARFGDVPHVDPFDGGANAACLLLLETPGPRASVIRFVSRDNATATARNITRFCEAADLQRRDTILWNAVPWVIHAHGAANRPPSRAEIADGLTLLPGFLEHLPMLRVVVLAGRVAGLAAAIVGETLPDVVVLRMPHPSPVYVNTSPAIAPGIIETLRTAASLVAARSDASSFSTKIPSSSTVRKQTN